jgi:L-alanine-DL-glutamate epimerase-like enolase superfamily enzyme
MSHSARSIPAYAGGVSLGYQDPQALVAEARPHLDAGYKALKLRVGDSPRRDLERIAAVRKAFGDELVILTDANIGYSVEDARAVMPPHFDRSGCRMVMAPSSITRLNSKRV